MRTFIKCSLALLCLLGTESLWSQSADRSIAAEPGITGTLLLGALVLAVCIVLAIVKISAAFSSMARKEKADSRKELKSLIENLNEEELQALAGKTEPEFNLEGHELSGIAVAKDEKGLIRQVENEVHSSPMVSRKKGAVSKMNLDPAFSKLILAFIGSAAFWLIFGTLIGQYLGMKFVWPELDSIAWLSFGRLRPVHTNAVFWGWSSMAMLGLGHLVVARTCNTAIYSLKAGWAALMLINSSVIIGSLLLMNGVNNGGGEYREYIWPVTALFAAGLIICLWNFYQTIARRNTKEIYVSNWYILGACAWTLVLVTIAYLPFYQNGLGETIIQGYYMHQGVGMWFMTFTLGLVYYFLPQSLNKPIYSYSLGVLAFWTQMLFYTLIGTHHFVFSPIPWSLQTVAIVFSMGMLIPVIAGTTNFLLTFRGSWRKLKDSYVLPFLLVGIVFYFVGSGQGTMQAFRFTNVIWHFTDFNVAHSHMTMYGIIAFFLWGGIYYLVPRITGQTPKELLVGAHFWMAFVGLIIYMFSMMIGGTLKGVSWLEGESFIKSVTLMAPYWLWRAIGGTMMFLSHIIFGINLWRMSRLKSKEPDLTDQLILKYEKKVLIS